jgi:tRNA(Ile)-lysidine synthase
MTRSHPPTLITMVARTLREECELAEGERVLVAVSGGGDSMALLHVLAKLRARFGFELCAHGVDHGLREEAGHELELAQKLACELSVPFTTTRLAVEHGGNLQARARAARYEALRCAAKAASCGVIATGHHADDRAETVLLRMLRGAGPRGLAVMPPRSGAIVRPLVRARRSDVERHLARHGLAHASDPSNLSRRFLRVRVREEILPALEALSPRIVVHLNDLADQLLSGPPPRLLDEQGRELELGRAHIEQIRRAQRLGQRGARIRVARGRVVRLDPETKEPELLWEG